MVLHLPGSLLQMDLLKVGDTLKIGVPSGTTTHTTAVGGGGPLGEH